LIQNFISKLSPQEKKIFYAACVIVVVALMDRIFLGPAMSKIKTYDEEIGKEKEVIRGDLRLLSYRDRILSEEKAFRPLYLVKEKTAEEITASFLKKLELLAGESAINLIKVNPAESKQKKSHVEYYANLDCEGKLEDMAKFMYAVDTSPELLKIVQLKVGAKKAGSEDVAANMTVMKIIVDSTLALESENLAKKVIDLGTPGGVSQDSSAPQKTGDGLGGSGGGGGSGGQGGVAGGGTGQEGKDNDANAQSAGGVAGNVAATGSGSKNVPSGATAAGGAVDSTAGNVDGQGQSNTLRSISGGAATTQRFSTKTVKADNKPVKPEEVDEIQPSLWEKFIKKTFKGKVVPEEPTAAEEEPAAGGEESK